VQLQEVRKEIRENDSDSTLLLLQLGDGLEHGAYSDEHALAVPMKRP
jgi:hypothetical protein